MLKEDELNFIYLQSSVKMKADVFRTSRILKPGDLYLTCVKSLKEAKSIMWGT